MARISAIFLAVVLMGAASPDSSLEVEVSGLRNSRGIIHACLTRTPAHFPKCEKDPHAVTRTAQASAHRIDIPGLAPGTYAVALFHDENSNRKLDKMMGIPREGFGFSRSPVVRFGPPKFEQVRITIGPGVTRQAVRMQYIL